MTIVAALREDAPYEEDAQLEDALEKWLRQERGGAILTQASEGPASLREWQLDKYAFSIQQERRKPARIEEEVVEEFSAR